MTDFVFLWQLNRKFMRWMPEDFYYKNLEILDMLRMVRIFSNEAADVELRNRLSKHPRNNGRDNTVHEELADALMLALRAITVFDSSALEDDACVFMDLTGMDKICSAANATVEEYALGFEIWQHFASYLILCIAEYPGMNTEFELCKCWHRLAWKHASKNMDSYPEELKLWQ